MEFDHDNKPISHDHIHNKNESQNCESETHKKEHHTEMHIEPSPIEQNGLETKQDPTDAHVEVSSENGLKHIQSADIQNHNSPNVNNTDENSHHHDHKTHLEKNDEPKSAEQVHTTHPETHSVHDNE